LQQKLSSLGKPLRYFVVAGIGFCVDYSIYAALVAAGVSIYIANAVSFSIGAVLAVVLIRAFVFQASRFALGADILLTFATNGTMLLVGMGILWLLVEVLSTGPYWAKLTANGVTFVLNYLTRATIFRK
jgi:putative flippase GtrA